MKESVLAALEDGALNDLMEAVDGLGKKVGCVGCGEQLRAITLRNRREQTARRIALAVELLHGIAAGVKGKTVKE